MSLLWVYNGVVGSSFGRIRAYVWKRWPDT